MMVDRSFRRRWKIAGLAAAMVALGGLVIACAPPYGEALLVLRDVAAIDGPSRLKATTPPPVRRQIAYSVEGRRRLADLYQPGEPVGGALVVVPGATPHGKDDARLVAFATTLARARHLVIVPELPNLRRLKLGAADARAVADAVDHLATRIAESDDRTLPLGLVAVSYAMGPTVIAVAETEARDRVDFVVGIGGYYDIETALTFATTGCFREAVHEAWQCRPANTYAKWVFAKSNADRLNDPSDAILLNAIADRRLADPDAEVDALAARLGQQGRQVFDLLVNRDPARAPELIDTLPPAIRSEMASLDLKRLDLGDLPQRVFLIHGEDDPILPAVESRRLAAALPDERVDLYSVDSLGHVELKPAAVWDQLKLLHAVATILALRGSASN